MSEYIKIHFDSVIDISRIVSLHYFKYVKNFWGEGEAHDFWELVYVDSGELEIIADREHFVLSKGQCFLHKPMEYHNVISRGQFASAFITAFECLDSPMQQLAHRVINLDETQQRLIADIFSEGQKAYQGPFDVISMKMLTRSKNPVFGAEQIVKTTMERLMISLIRKDMMSVEADEPESPILLNKVPNQNRVQIINAILSVLTANLNQNVSLETICKSTGFSRSYLERIFFEEMNCGIKQYFAQMKMERAKELISEQVYTFTEISAMLGFNSIHYFSRIFKKETGMTPTEYRSSILAKKMR